MNKIDKDYQELLNDILENGIKKNTRNGEVLSVFGKTIRYKFENNKFPLLTTKKMYTKGIIAELIWFLRGDTNIKFLVDNNCHIWDGDAYKAYYSAKSHPLDGKFGDTSIRKLKHMYPYEPILSKDEFIDKIKTDDEFANKWGELGPIYGKQWVNWGGYYSSGHVKKDGTPGVYFKGINQISNLIKDLNSNPDSRRLMVSAWNVDEIDSAVLPPCHYGFQVYTRELSLVERKEYGIEVLGYDVLLDYGHTQNDDDKILDFLNYWKVPARAISLMWNQRSCDFPLGIPYNIASYAFLLEILAKKTNMIPDELIGSLGDCHIYINQIEGVKEQLTRNSYELPEIKLSNDFDWLNSDLDSTVDWMSKNINNCFEIINYKSHPTIKFPLSN